MKTATEKLMIDLYEKGLLTHNDDNILDDILKEHKEIEKNNIKEAWNDGHMLGRNGLVLLEYYNGEGYVEKNFND